MDENMTMERTVMSGVVESVKEKKKLKRPSKFDIYVLNNDVTGFEVVLAILVAVFNKSFVEAMDIAGTAHKSGKALVVKGLSREMANTLFSAAKDLSQRIDNGRLKFELTETK